MVASIIWLFDPLKDLKAAELRTIWGEAYVVESGQWKLYHEPFEQKSRCVIDISVTLSTVIRDSVVIKVPIYAHLCLA